MIGSQPSPLPAHPFPMLPSMLVKICGMTRAEDVDLASEFGVDAVGFVLWPRSPRCVNAAQAAALVRRLPGRVTPVGVFVNPTDDEVEAAIEAGIRIAQCHGSEFRPGRPWQSRVPLWRAASLEADLSAIPESITLLLDAHDPERHGGTGRTIDWTRAAAVARTRRVILAGGLTADNVADAARQVRPYGVDVSSGVEERPGIKRAAAMQAFVTAVREAER